MNTSKFPYKHVHPFGGAPLELTDLAISFLDSVISATASIPSEFYPLPVPSLQRTNNIPLAKSIALQV